MSDDTMRDDAMYDDGPAPRGAGDPAVLPPACAAFDAALADRLDGTLAATARAEMDAHRAGCARCDALLADLEAIAVAARALPAIVPSDATTEAMWRGVSARIARPAVPIGTARSALRRVRFDGWRRQVAAAAALVLVTAGVTYSVTHVVEGRNRTNVAAVTDGRGAAAPSGPLAPQVGEGDTGTTRLASGGDSVLAGAPSGANRPPSIGPSGVTAHVVRNGPAARPSATATYEREIRGLGRILDERRGELDSTTVVVLERNLAVIDQAIRQSREALARDPRSRFLGQQLNSALDKKVELLRTAALLPSRT